VYHREGLFSAVYKVVAPRDVDYFPKDSLPTKELVALKVTTPSMMEPPHDSKREAHILALAASPNVIPLRESFREAGSHFVLVFPFMPFDFVQVLENGGASNLQIQSTLRDLFSALEFIHGRGIIHRDIKPSNIMLKSANGPAYLADFGISWAPNVPGAERADEKITDVGTTCYRAPELLFGNKSYGCSLDLWATGCTVAEALLPPHPTLFDSGELGSDLALIQSMFSKLGTPNLKVWPVSGQQNLRMAFHAHVCRKPRISLTGVKYSSTSTLRSRGPSCCQRFPKLDEILLQDWYSMKAVLESQQPR
jgi:serine/threonine protein kinase